MRLRRRPRAAMDADTAKVISMVDSALTNLQAEIDALRAQLKEIR